MYLHTHIYICIHIYMYIYVNIHIPIYIYNYVYIHISIYIYIYIYIYGGEHAPAFFARTPLPFAHTPLHFACACPTTHHKPPLPPPSRATRFCEQEKDAGKKIQADIDKQYDELIRQTEAMLVKQSSLVTNDTIAQSIVGVLCKSFLAAPNVKVVLVLNSCFSVH